MGNLRNSTVGLIAATLLLAAPALADTATPPTVPATATTAPATDAPLPLAGKTLKVGMRLVPPFVFKKDDALTGFSYELWAELAKATGATTDLQLIDTLPHVLEAVSTQKVDLAIYSISITAKRELDFDFSQPMFDAGLQVAVRSDASGNASAWSAIARMFTSGPILNLVGLLGLSSNRAN